MSPYSGEYGVPEASNAGVAGIMGEGIADEFARGRAMAILAELVRTAWIVYKGAFGSFDRMGYERGLA